VLIAGLVATEFWVSHLHNNNEAAEKARQVSIALESLDELQRENLLDYAAWDSENRAIQFRSTEQQTGALNEVVSEVGASAELLVLAPSDGGPNYGWASGSAHTPHTDLLPERVVAALLDAINKEPSLQHFVATKYIVIKGEVWRLMATRAIPSDGASQSQIESMLPGLISGVRLTDRYLEKLAFQANVHDMRPYLGSRPNLPANRCHSLIDDENGAWLCWQTNLPGDVMLHSSALPLLTLAVIMVLALGICFRQMLRAAQSLERAMLRAVRADDAKTEFLATVTHELRTPLNGVLGIGEILRNTALSSRQRDMLEVMIRSGHTLLDLVNDLLDIAKIEAGQRELEIAPFDIGQTLQSIDELLRPMAAKRGLALDFQSDSYIPLVIGDNRALHQVLVNLIGNAIKFTYKGRVSVGVKASSHGDQVRLEFRITDTGQGIAPENIGRIFDRFFQVPHNKLGESSGTGLGLAVSSALVKMMGGSITVDSTPNIGSTFRIELWLLGVEDSMVIADARHNIL